MKLFKNVEDYVPLAIVAIGGLLSTKAKTMFEWRKLSENLRMELECNVHLTSIDSLYKVVNYPKISLGHYYTCIISYVIIS
jgi:disease resistance protein RPM1